jgi:hypothetical protein
MGSVAATKSTKDKGFSKVFIGVFIWTKVRREELCQGGSSLGFLMSGGIFELGDTGKGGMEG